MDITPLPPRSEQELADSLAIADLVRRVAGDSGVHVYEVEVRSPTDYACLIWVGEALETLLGAAPEGMDAEDAWEACIHPDDLAAYHATVPELFAGRPADLEYRLVGFDGVTRWVWQRCRPRMRVNGRVLVDGIVSDITQRRAAEDALEEARGRLRHLAYHDWLTGLPNRLLFEERLAEAIDECDRSGGAFSVVFIDLDDFKLVNDRHGHAAGDDLLQVVAERLLDVVGCREAVARLGGDEFLVIGPAGDSAERAAAATAPLIQAIRTALSARIVVAGQSISPGASIGAAIYPVDGVGKSALLAAADLAMYRDKSLRGRSARAA